MIRYRLDSKRVSLDKDHAVPVIHALFIQSSIDSMKSEMQGNMLDISKSTYPRE